jgi:hypothetical protein
MASRHESIRGAFSKRVAKQLLNKIRENAGFHEHIVVRIEHLVFEHPAHHVAHENQEGTSLEGSLPHLWR